MSPAKKKVSARTGKSRAASVTRNAQVGNPAQSCFEFEAEVIEISFESPVKVSWNNGTVTSPHYEKSLSGALADTVRTTQFGLSGNTYSTRPAAYVVKGAPGSKDTVQLKVHVTKSKCVSGTGTLKGALRGLLIEGQCPTSTGTHTIAARIKHVPSSVQWYHGPMQWTMQLASPLKTVPMNSTLVELFFTLETPIAVFQNRKGVWAEALRFLCAKAKVVGKQTPQAVASAITTYCHGKHGLLYDSAGGGRSSYGVGHQGGRLFLENYLLRMRKTANCYDQAAALQALCGSVGVELSWIFLDPYGYINKTKLLGYGDCNNPFFKMNGSPKEVDVNDRQRTSFGNHAFCERKGRILDACAGPHLGTETRGEYVKASIDTTTKLYALFGEAHGTAADMIQCPGVQGVL